MQCFQILLERNLENGKRETASIQEMAKTAAIAERRVLRRIRSDDGYRQTVNWSVSGCAGHSDGRLWMTIRLGSAMKHYGH